MNVITRLILGGAQEVAIDSTAGLRALGHDVTLVTGPPLGPEGELISTARERGIDPVLLGEMRREIHPILDATAYWKLVRLFKRAAPQIVHSHSSKAGILARFAARAAGVPIVVHTIHGLPFHDGQNGLVRRFFIACERAAARRADRIVVVSHQMAANAARAGIAPVDAFTRIFAGFDVRAFAEPNPELVAAFRKQWGAGTEEVVIGCVARLAPLKGHADLIEAFARLHPQNARLRIVFIGDGPLAERLKQQCRSRGLEGWVQFQGLVGVRQVPAAFGALDLLAHCSVREGLARVLPQAIAAGKPVICYNIDGAREVVSEETGGALVEPGDVDTLTDRLGELCANPDAVRSRMGGARKYVEKHFSLDSTIASLHKLYTELADGKL